MGTSFCVVVLLPQVFLDLVTMFFSVAKPIVEVKPAMLTLKNDESGEVQCSVMGQLGLNAKWDIKSGDTMAMDSFYSNSTNGTFYNETRLLKIKKPIAYGEFCSLNKEEAVIVCKSKYTCRAEYIFENDTSVEKNATVFYKKGYAWLLLISFFSLFVLL